MDRLGRKSRLTLVLLICTLAHTHTHICIRVGNANPKWNTSPGSHPNKTHGNQIRCQPSGTTSRTQSPWFWTPWGVSMVWLEVSLSSLEFWYTNENQDENSRVSFRCEPMYSSLVVRAIYIYIYIIPTTTISSLPQSCKVSRNDRALRHLLLSSSWKRIDLREFLKRWHQDLGCEMMVRSWDDDVPVDYYFWKEGIQPTEWRRTETCVCVVLPSLCRVRPRLVFWDHATCRLKNRNLVAGMDPLPKKYRTKMPNGSNGRTLYL